MHIYNIQHRKQKYNLNKSIISIVLYQQLLSEHCVIMNMKNQQYLVEAYETRVADQEKKKLLLPIPINEDLKAKMSSQKREWGANWWQQFSILFRRGFKERQHDYLSWMRITQVIATAIILGLLWWHSDSSTPKGLQDQV